jgi:ADP-heptose:LPS heptosyltransferase
MKRRARLLLLRLLALLARPLARRATGPPRAILYIKPDHLGDLLLATPVLAALRAAFPEARITALVGPWSRLVLARNPDVDALLTCPFPGFERRPPDNGRPTAVVGRHRSHLSSAVGRRWSKAGPYLTMLRYAALLRTTRYDLAIIGRDDHWWGAALALLAGVPVRVGFAVPECRPFLTTALPWNPRDHVTAQGLALVAAAGGRTADNGPPPTVRHRPLTDEGPGTKDEHRPNLRGRGRQHAKLAFAAFVPVLRPSSARNERQRTNAGRTFAGEADSLSGLLSSFADRPSSIVAHRPPASDLPMQPSRLPMRFAPAPADEAWAAAWLAAHGVAPGDRLVIIHPGTGGPDKHWPAARWSAVGDALVAMDGGGRSIRAEASGAHRHSPASKLRLVLTGGPGEEGLVAEVATGMRAAPLMLAGQTTLGQLAALLRRADLVLGVDSGPLHLAAAVGAPSIHLYGPSDADRFGPWGDPARHVVLRAGVWCAPCGVFAACPRGLALPECMGRIDTARVVAEARRMLGMPAARPAV